MRSLSLCLVVATWAVGLAAVPARSADLVAPKVDNIGTPDPAAAYWQKATAVPVSLVSQPMVKPMPTGPGTASVSVQAVHDGQRIAFRMVWKDPEKSIAGKVGELSDAMALEFPIKNDPLPPVMMGAKDMPVHLFHWRAQYQNDAEKGKPTVKDLYPNSSVDMYPMEFTAAASIGDPASREKFSPGVALGNPQAYAKSGVDEMVAEGFSTSSVTASHGASSKAVWQNGEWTLVIVRPLAVEGGSTLVAGQKSNIAFAVWQGGQGDVGSRKSLTMQWTALTLAK